MNQAVSLCWLAAVLGAKCNPKKLLFPQQVLPATRCITVTFNLLLNHTIFPAGQGGEEIDPQIIFMYNFLSSGVHSIYLSPRGHIVSLPGCATNLEIELEGRKLETRAFSFQFPCQWDNLDVGVLQCRTPTHSIPFTWRPCHPQPTVNPLKPYSIISLLLSLPFKELYILKTVNFQAKVCHLLLAAGSPGKCR